MSEDTINRTYELGYLLVPNTPEPEVDSAVEALKAVIQKEGGSIVAEGAPEFIDLAYTMEKSVASKKYKYSQGYFGFIKFDVAPESLELIKKALDSNKSLIRYILLKTSVENTIVFKKPKVEAKRGVESDGEVIVMDEESVDMDEEVLDHEKLPVLDEPVAAEPIEAEEA